MKQTVLGASIMLVGIVAGCVICRSGHKKKNRGSDSQEKHTV